MGTSLSVETAIRSGFDALLVETLDSRREARDLIRLAEEADAAVAFPRWLRRLVPAEPGFSLVTIVAGVNCALAHLVDLALWLSSATGIQRLELESAGDVMGLAMRGYGGQLMSVQTTPLVDGVRVTAGSIDAGLDVRLPWRPDEGLRSEAALFAENPGEAVLLEDSVDVIAVLERLSQRGR